MPTPHMRTATDIGPANRDADIMGPIFYDIQRGIAEGRRLGDAEQVRRNEQFYQETLNRKLREQGSIPLDHVLAPATKQKAESKISKILNLIVSDAIGVARK